MRAASRAYATPRTTLQQYVNATTRNRQLSSEHVVGHTRRYSALGAQSEKELSDHAKRLSELFFGITKEQLCKLAYELAWKNGLQHPFNKYKRAAGDDWFHGFMSRNPILTLRKPESTSIARVMGFRRSEVNRFFDNLKQVYEREKFDPSCIFNVDETGMSTCSPTTKTENHSTDKQETNWKNRISGERRDDHGSRVC